MKIKFTLRTSERPEIDLVATVDAAATVGDLASYLVRADPRGGSRTSPEDATLGLVGIETRALDPRVTVAESGLHSGATVTISRGGNTFRDPQAGAAAVVTVTAGPDVGREFALHHGPSVIGRERGSEVRLSDPLISRQHARLNVTDQVEVVDLGSANGIALGGAVVARAALRAGETLSLGDTELTVRMLAAAPAVTGADAAAVSFVRPPRLDPTYAGASFAAPEPPERAGRQRFPLIPMMAPIFMGGLLYLITRSLTSIVFVALSPVMLIGSALESRSAGARAFKKALKLWQSDLDDLETEASAAAAAEVLARNREHPPLGECIEATRLAAPLVWTRRPGERGFAELKLGNGRQPSRNSIELPDARRAPRELYKELVARTARFAFVDDVPVIARPAELGSIGIAGSRPQMLAAARASIAQLAVLHSPAELVISGFTSSLTARDWDWIKWLPHTSSSHSPFTTRQLAASAPAANKLMSELEDLVAGREAGAGPAVLVLVEHDAPVEHSRLVELAELGWKHGVYVLWLAHDVTRLPAACRVFAEISATTAEGAVGFVHSGESVAPMRIELLDPAGALFVARQLSPMVDIGARIDDDSDLPRAVSLLTLTGAQLATIPEAVIERWTESRSIVTGPLAPPTPARHAGTLRAIVGQAAGEPLALDLRTDGPHALVGGTTGSGKSELLQAWILAMAAAHSPQRLAFLLVDYKGGSAFRDCVNLPHTVGLVTDLSPHLVRRALTSLSAELRYREHVLARHGAKDLVTLEKQGVADAPPSLVLVVDEFAALVQEVPEFVDGVVNVAQRGRSLGLHLILATQRPAGVIKDNLRANTNLRLALRMADEADSTDVLGSPQAAFFDSAIPGRAVSKTGPGRLIPFQTAYAGGWTTDRPPVPELVVEELGFGAGVSWELVDDVETNVAEQGESDIKRIVRSIQQASDLASISPPRKPWLPELKDVYDLADQAEVPSRRRDTELVFGVRDDPENQAQPTVAFFPDRDGNLAVYGTGGSGKSTLLRTLAIAAGFTVRGGPCHVYGLDFGARGLSMLEPLPHVGSIIAGSDHERITRLLGWLRDLVDERAVRYSRANAGTITEYRHLAGAPDEPRILLLIDGIGAFRQAYEVGDRSRWFDLLISIATDGRPVGVHLAITADRAAAVPSVLASALQRRLVLRMADTADYPLMGVASDVLATTSPAGRGLLDDDEVQIALLCKTALEDDPVTGERTKRLLFDVGAQADAIREFAASMARALDTAPAPEVRRLSEKVALSTLPISADRLPAFGLSATTLGPVGFEPHGSFIISGPPGSGRSTALVVMAESLRRWDPVMPLYYFGNQRSGLSSWPGWTGSATGSQVNDYAQQLAGELAMRSSATPVAVFIERVSDFVGAPAEGPLQELAKICLAEDWLIVVEGESSVLSTSYGLLAHAKSSRAGIALAPETADGSAIYRTSFPPRLNRAEFPPGRGLLVSAGKTTIIQVADAGRDGLYGE